MENFETARIMLSNKLLKSRQKMNLRERKAFYYSLYALQKGQDRLFVRVNLTHFLGLEATPSSYTKEYIAKAFKSLKKPCICLDGKWIPAYTKATWEADTILLIFHPKISDNVLGVHNVMPKNYSQDI